MKALKLYGIRDIRFDEASEEPQIKNGSDVKIRIKAAGICGSDISRYAKLGPYVPGMIWGHEFAGEVVEVGSEVDRFKAGDRVTVSPAMTCRTCESCRAGKPAQCEHLEVLGAKEPGAFAEYIVVPAAHVVDIPDGVSFEAAAMTEPSAVVAHGFYKTPLQPGDSVAVLGCGTIGLLAVQWAKIFGAEKVIALDIDDEKLALAKSIGADETINSMGVEPYEKVLEVTNGHGVTLSVESAGTPITSAQAFSLPGKGGSVLYLGIPYGDVMVKRLYFEKIVRNELKVFGSWNAVSAPYPGKEWTSTLYFMQAGKLQTAPLITHRASFAEGPRMFEMTAERKESFGKIMFLPEA
ncbi:galactitol-1-phosphate 5-dehydrogenase [Selenomonas sp. TAMA-11512]|uniref:galactitol-1-phosphate 5-dehydrogenase n=1 Tax=Selenomonas sp. TAMA-11512 TaxID=3095337 RepID=UPI00308BA743|nr:galactitol-1-phosphate 5-dehydrogenase [Selenomonas sp. TAMA-11512]